MDINSMRAESLDEARERMRAMSAAERQGFEASAEGQLTITRTPEQDERAAQVDEMHGAIVTAFDQFSIDAGEPAMAASTEGAPAKASRRAAKKPA